MSCESCCCACLSPVQLFFFGVAVLYPLFCSLKATTPESQQRWLSFWVFLAPLFLLEDLFGSLFGCSCMSAFRGVYALWLYHDEFKGRNFLLDNFVRPHWPAVDAVLGSIMGMIPLGIKQKTD